jgi:hypothetical protein
MTLSFASFLSDEENPKRFATDAPIVDKPPSQEVDPAAKSPKSSEEACEEGSHCS